eukprot:TRINITY_DN9582_c0_g2_i1.p1 TRINITY_DN9582_c0_g2~~TRINITY_DN9582_c0_g2_i1.p1  ORF type:complete len:678 (+),score=77.00 TRINITY_DN9582_c0_g2_i1:605-2638(+)
MVTRLRRGRRQPYGIDGLDNSRRCSLPFLAIIVICLSSSAAEGQRHPLDSVRQIHVESEKDDRGKALGPLLESTIFWGKIAMESATDEGPAKSSERTASRTTVQQGRYTETADAAVACSTGLTNRRDGESWFTYDLTQAPACSGYCKCQTGGISYCSMCPLGTFFSLQSQACTWDRPRGCRDTQMMGEETAEGIEEAEALRVAEMTSAQVLEVGSAEPAAEEEEEINTRADEEASDKAMASVRNLIDEREDLTLASLVQDLDLSMWSSFDETGEPTLRRLVDEMKESEMHHASVLQVEEPELGSVARVDRIGGRHPPGKGHHPPGRGGGGHHPPGSGRRGSGGGHGSSGGHHPHRWKSPKAGRGGRKHPPGSGRHPPGVGRHPPRKRSPPLAGQLSPPPGSELSPPAISALSPPTSQILLPPSEDWLPPPPEELPQTPPVQSLFPPTSQLSPPSTSSPLQPPRSSFQKLPPPPSVLPSPAVGLPPSSPTAIPLPPPVAEDSLFPPPAKDAPLAPPVGLPGLDTPSPAPASSRPYSSPPPLSSPAETRPPPVYTPSSPLLPSPSPPLLLSSSPLFFPSPSRVSTPSPVPPLAVPPVPPISEPRSSSPIPPPVFCPLHRSRPFPLSPPPHPPFCLRQRSILQLCLPLPRCPLLHHPVHSLQLPQVFLGLLIPRSCLFLH